jgi:hypothetical protein
VYYIILLVGQPLVCVSVLYYSTDLVMIQLNIIEFSVVTVWHNYISQRFDLNRWVTSFYSIIWLYDLNYPTSNQRFIHCEIACKLNFRQSWWQINNMQISKQSNYSIQNIGNFGVGYPEFCLYVVLEISYNMQFYTPCWMIENGKMPYKLSSELVFDRGWDDLVNE